MPSSLFLENVPREDVNITSTCIPTNLTRTQSLGLLVNIQVGCASIIAVLIVFFVIIVGVIRTRRQYPLRPWSDVIQSPLQIYMLSLFFADLIQGIGQALSIRWLVNGQVKCGTFCNAQGVTQQIGDTAVSLSTLAIALHTFVIIFFGRGCRAKQIASLFLIPIWLFVILFATIGVGLHSEGSHPYITPTPYWCWIGKEYDRIRLAGEYAWFFVTVAVSVILYVLLYLCLRGIIVLDRDKWWRIRFRTSSSRARPSEVAAHPNGRALQAPESNNDDPSSRQDSVLLALKMLLYPLAYILVVLGTSIVRFSRKSIDHNAAPATIFAVSSLFAASGVINVVLWLFTRRRIVLIGAPEAQPAEAEDTTDQVSMTPRHPTPNTHVFHHE